ncbi:acyltransferase [Pseudomonas sp. KU26590]|nr:acyltransferase [Pseudomonas sp. KU26590]
MGAYRLVLAIVVALSHMGVRLFTYNPGVFAVVSFLIISGFVMTALVSKRYNSQSRIRMFYIDRALRLYPQFLLYFALSCIIIIFWLPPNVSEEAISVTNIIPSLAIAPLDLYMFGITNSLIIPPAWSLGLEAFFYIAIPFLIIYRLTYVGFALSLLFSIVPALGLIDSDVYGYRLLPGTLFIFLCGSYLYWVTKTSSALLLLAWVVSLVALTASLTGFLPRLGYTTEVSAGIVFGLPVIKLLLRLGYSKADEVLGNISYGVFLNHFVIMYAAEAFGYTPSSSTGYIICILVGSIIFSIFSYNLIERPVLRFRHALRGRNISRCETQSSS